VLSPLPDAFPSATTLRLAAVAAALLALGRAPQAWAQEPERRVLDVSVVDKDGSFVSGLATHNFRGKLDGKAAKILAASFDTSPRRIAVVVDKSGSMASKWGAAWAAAADLSLRLSPYSRIVVCTFDQTLHQHSDLSNDQGILQGALAKGRAQIPAGGSALYDGLVTVNGGPSGLDLDVIYLLTDGQDSTSLATATDAQRAAARRGVRVFVLLFRGDWPPASSPGGLAARQLGEYEMRALAEATGGYVFRAEQFKNLEGLRSFYPLIAGAYRLEVEFSQPAKEPREWTLEAIDPTGKKLKNVRLAYPRLLVPASAGVTEKGERD
jgi:hypothetical protein